MKKALLILVILSISLSCKKDNPTDPNLVNYESVTIGTQVWMKKNLDVDHYRNGDTIPEVRDSAVWVNLKTGAWCYYNNDRALGAIYGKLYNWYAVNDPRGLAPVGWHVPTNYEWQTSVSYIGGISAGGKLKDSSSNYWNRPNIGATNETGYSALPGGHRDGREQPQFDGLGKIGYWWTSSVYNNYSAMSRELEFTDANISELFINKSIGSSVRCIKD